MSNDVSSLNDAELEAVCGGMTCDTARIVAGIHATTAEVLGRVGQVGLALYFLGLAGGVTNGACR